MSEDQRLIQEFIGDLLKAWSVLDLSYDALERRAKDLAESEAGRGIIEHMPRSTTQGVLMGERRTLPRLKWVVSFVAVLRTILIERGDDPDTIGSIQEWEAKRARANFAILAARRARKAAARREQATPAIPISDDHTPVPLGSAPLSLWGGGLSSAGTADAEWSGHSPEDHRRAALLARASKAAPSAWWADYRDLVPPEAAVYLTLEPAARLQQIYVPRAVPSLLQTEDEAHRRARHRMPTATPDQLRRMVELQMLRQQSFRCTTAGHLWIGLDEAVLPGLPETQLGHILELCSLDNVQIQIVEYGTQARVSGPTRLLRFEETLFPDVVFLDASPDHYPQRSQAVHEHRRQLTEQFIAAASPEASTKILRRILNP